MQQNAMQLGLLLDPGTTDLTEILKAIWLISRQELRGRKGKQRRRKKKGKGKSKEQKAGESWKKKIDSCRQWCRKGLRKGARRPKSPTAEHNFFG